MKYRMSLDLGVTSIGCAIIALNENNEAIKIIDGACRIFELSEGAEERRQKRQMRKNYKRTKQRLKLLAKKLYEKGFWLSKNPATPEDNDKKRQHPYSLSPYAIRAHAIHGKLNNPNEFGRAILHIAKHRGAGFIDALEEEHDNDIHEDDEIKPNKEKKERKLSSYELLPKYMKEKEARTIGEYFNMRLKNKPGTGKIVRQRCDSLKKEKPVDYAIPRYLVKNEFHLIWDKQANYYPELKDKDFKKEIYDILFYEHPSAPYATANCIYIDGEDRLLKAHPLSEKRRIYEAANNIRILDDNNKRKLKKEERDKIINEILMQGKNANKKSVRNILGDKKMNVIFSDNNSGIKPYLYSKDEFTSLPIFSKITEEKLFSLIEFMANPVIDGDKHGRLYNEDDLLELLKDRFKCDNKEQIADLLVKLPKGRGMLGITATRNLLDLLENEVISHREAADKLVTSGDSRFKSEEVLAQETQGKYSKLPYYGEVLCKDIMPIHPWQKERNKTLNPDEARYGKIANPGVHRMLNQLRFVVNDTIRRYGRPYEINIELGRDVGMSTKKKNQYEKIKNQNQKLNEEAEEYLKNNKIRITRNNKLKYKLAKEQGWKDAFNPHNSIGAHFDGYEIEHLVPQALGGSDTPANLVLVNRNENATKGNLFPYEFFSREKTPEQIREILKNSRERLPDNKKWRFESDAHDIFEEEGDNSATDRYLTDTRYMAKIAARYLRTILDFKKSEDSNVINTRILTIKGYHTAKLRTAWNLDGLEYELMGLDIPRYIDCDPYWVDEETGEVIEGAKEPDMDGKWGFFDKKKNPDWMKKPRIDHRHHVLDAIVLGCINRNFSNSLNWADKRGYTLNYSAYPLPLTNMNKENAKQERTKFRKEVLELLRGVKVSHKSEHSKNGQLHKETGKTMLYKHEDNKTVTVRYYRKVLDVVKNKSDLKKLLVKPSIKSEWHKDIAKDRESLEKLKSDFENHYDEARSLLEKENITQKKDGGKPKEISEAMILAKAFQIIKENKLWDGGWRFPAYKNEKSLIAIEKHNFAYTYGNNHRVDFYEKDGKVKCEVISNFDANNKDFVPEYKKLGCKLIWSLHQGDMIELDTPDEWKSLSKNIRCIAKIKSFRHGRNRVNIILSHDARNGKNRPKPSFMFPSMLVDKGFVWFGKSNTRKIELTPSGSVKKKHRKLWYGKKKTA